MKKITILMAAVALVCFSVPAMAVDWNFYGNARMATYYTSEDLKDNGPKASGMDWDLQGNSRFGANIKADHIKGQVEMGINESSVSARRVYGTWNFGAGYLKVGKDYTPVDQFISGQVFDGDLGLLGVGTQYGGRHGQIALGFGGFEIALINPTTDLLSNMETTASTIIQVPGQPGQPPISIPTSITTTANGEGKKIIPRIAAKWGMGFDAWNFNVMGGFQYYSIKDVQPVDGGGTDDVEVTSWTVGADAGFNFGPAYVKGAVSYGQNIGNASWGLPGQPTSGSGGLAWWDGDDDTNDTDTLMGALVAGMKVSDMLAFEAGLGYRNDATDGGGPKNTSPMAVYLQSVITLAPGVFIIPEVGYYDYDNNADGDDAGTLMYFGGKWQINF
jgi:hypothetical protein